MTNGQTDLIKYTWSHLTVLYSIKSCTSPRNLFVYQEMSVYLDLLTFTSPIDIAPTRAEYNCRYRSLTRWYYPLSKFGVSGGDVPCCLRLLLLSWLVMQLRLFTQNS